MQFLRTNYIKILKVLGILLIASILLFIAAYLLNGNPDINEFEVTNISSNSFSISWSSDNAYIASVQYSDSDNWLLFLDRFSSKNVAFDDRDVNVDTSNVVTYSNEKAQPRKFHQITLRNLDAGKQYFFRVNGSIRTYVPIVQNNATTLPQDEKVNQPDTAYGKVVNYAVNGTNPADGIVYYRLVDRYDDEDVSALYSSIIGSNSGWSGDLSNLHTEYGYPFQWDKENYKVYMEVRSDVGYGWANLSLAEYKPIEEAAINVRYIADTVPTSSSGDDSTASADKGVLGLSTDMAVQEGGGNAKPTGGSSASSGAKAAPASASANKSGSTGVFGIIEKFIPQISFTAKPAAAPAVTPSGTSFIGVPAKPATNTKPDSGFLGLGSSTPKTDTKPNPPAVTNPNPPAATNNTNSGTTNAQTKPPKPTDVVIEQFGHSAIVTRNGENISICTSTALEPCSTNGCFRTVSCGPGGEFNSSACRCAPQGGSSQPVEPELECPVATIWSASEKKCKGTGVTSTGIKTTDHTLDQAPVKGGGELVANKPEKPNDPKTRAEGNKQVAAGTVGTAAIGVGALAQGKTTSCEKVTNKIICPAVSCVGLPNSIIGTEGEKTDGNVRCSYAGTVVSVGTCKDVGGSTTFSQFLSADNQAAICGDKPVVDLCPDKLKGYTCPGGMTCSNGDSVEVRQTTSGSSVICDYKTVHKGGATSGITKVGATCNNNNLVTNSIDVKTQSCSSLKDTSADVPVEKDNGTTVLPSACNSDVLSGKYANQGIHCYDDNKDHPGTQRCKGAVSIKWCDPAPTSLVIDSPLSPVKIVHAQPVPVVLDPVLLSKGTYSIVIPGYKNAEFSVLNNNVTVKYFEDANSNGIKDADEVYIDPTQYTVTLAKLSDLSAYELNAGWNLIALNFASADFTKASDLIKSINNQGIAAVQISKYDSGNWIHFVYRLNEQGAIESFGSDFTLVPGEGYFVRTLDNGIVQFKGQKFTSSVPINLSTGWNLAAILSPIDYTANSFITKCNALGAQCTTISRFADNVYESVVNSDGVFFGNNFKLIDTEGYFVLNKSANKTISP